MSVRVRGGRHAWRLWRFAASALLGVSMVACGGGGGSRQAEPLTPDARLRAAVTADGLAAHLQVFQRYADLGNGSRAEGSIGYTRSVEYVTEQLRAAGYRVTTQPFTFSGWRELRPTVFELVAPVSRRFDAGDFSLLPGSRGAQVTAWVQPTNDIVLAPDDATSSTSGCESEDFAGFVPGNVALVQRGTCALDLKVNYAASAGAAAILIIDEPRADGGDLPRFQPAPAELQRSIRPTLFVPFEIGVELYRSATSGQPLRAHIVTRTGIARIESTNVLAESARGRRDRTTVIGAHLDSIVHGPGLNDNGSGSALVLEVALQLAATAIEPTNRIVFAWWGGEESGWEGSKHYLSGLSPTEIAEIAAYLNFDMVGSPNFGRQVDDGDGSVFRAGPAGSGAIERMFLEYFKARGLRTLAPSVDLHEQSDMRAFVERDIPVGGLFTGAGETKPAWQVELFGGQGDAAYDPCYHAGCDRYPENIDVRVLEQMADAAAHVLLRLAGRGSPLP